MEGFDEEAPLTLREELELVDRDLGTAAGSIDMGTINENEYLREGLFALHEAVVRIARVLSQLIDDGTPGARADT